MTNRDSAPNLNDKCLLEPSHAAPNDMVSAPCIDAKANHATVTAKGCQQSDNNPANGDTLTFSIDSDEGIDLFVDLNCDSPATCMNMYNKKVCIPVSNDHSKHASLAINSLVSKGNHCQISPSGNIIADIQNNGAGSADCCTKPSICLAGGESSRSEHCPLDTAAENSRSSASSLPGNLVEISGSQDGVQVVPSSGAEASHNSDTDTQGALNENEPVEAVAMEEDVACGDSLPDVQLDASPEDLAVDGNFNLTNPTPSSAALASMVDSVMENDASEFQNAKATEKSGGSTDNSNDEVFAGNVYVKIEVLTDMNIQKIMDEGEMTGKVMSILKGYEGSSSGMMEVDSSGERCQTMNVKRRRLTEGIFLRNKCKELDEICRENYWMPPRYLVDVSVTDEMFQASVQVIGLDLNMSIDGDLKISSSEARESAAANMLYQLHQKAKEKAADQNSRAADAILPN